MTSRALPPARLLAVVAPVSIVGVAAYCAATFHFLAHPGSRTDIAGVAAFLLASTLAERYPVPVVEVMEILIRGASFTMKIWFA